MTTSILIADEQRMIRDGLRGILAVKPDLRVVTEAADGPEAVARARECDPDIALIELHLPLLSGLDAIRSIRAANPRTRCIALSTRQTPERVREALLAGAAAFVSKNSAACELLDAIEAVRAGRSYLAPAVAESVVSAITRRAVVPDPEQTELTDRQRQVLQLIAEGLSTKEIATQLGISIKTAQTHRAKLMSKVGVHKASGLVRYAIREGIVAV